MLLRTLHKKIEELMKKDPDNGNKEIRIAQYETLECDENGAVFLRNSSQIVIALGYCCLKVSISILWILTKCCFISFICFLQIGHTIKSIFSII